MSVCHSDLSKKKSSGGRRRAYRKKRKFEQGSFASETSIGKLKKKVVKGRGLTSKIRVLSIKNACVTTPKNGRTEKVEIKRVIRNPANIDYDRRGIITKGTLIETELGIAQITSRPGQDGVINAILIETKDKK